MVHMSQLGYVNNITSAILGLEATPRDLPPFLSIAGMGIPDVLVMGRIGLPWVYSKIGIGVASRSKSVM